MQDGQSSVEKPIDEQAKREQAPRFKNLGFIVIPDYVIVNPKTRGAVYHAFGNFIPLKHEHDALIEGHVYFGISHQFRELAENEQIPEYRIITEVRADKVKFVKFVEVTVNVPPKPESKLVKV